MTQRCRPHSIVGLLLAVMYFMAPAAEAIDAASLVPADQIAELKASLAKTEQSKSSARVKLAHRRVVREAEALLAKYTTAPNRFEVLGVLFRSQQALVALENTSSNRAAFLKTCQLLQAAPDEYAAIRLDADLLLSQSELARRGVDANERAKALRPLVDRYRDTAVEAKVIRIAMLMALEFGDAGVVNQLRDVIAHRFAGNLDMIIFQREKLAGQVFGAPFIGTFERSDGKRVSFPMDYLGTTTKVFFWSKENGGVEHLKELAVVWKTKKDEAAGRLRFVSINLDNLPDAGEKTLRDLGLDWPALRLPEGRDSMIYKAYARRDPTLITLSPIGYAALFLAGGNSHTNGYERWLNSSLARVWTKPRYTSQLQSLFAGEFLIKDPQGAFDTSCPPECKALSPSKADQSLNLTRTAKSVPEDKLRAIQGCFLDPPFRYRSTYQESLDQYEKADALCRAAIAAHGDAPALWIVRNRRIVALMGLWKTTSNLDYFQRAVSEAKTMLESPHPQGTDVVARLCLARQAMRGVDTDPKAIIRDFVEAAGGQQPTAPALAAAAMLALDVGERRLHEQYRRALLDQHAEDPMMWTAVSFMLDRYHRYWMYHPPFVAGWTYGRRQGYFLAWGQPEDAQRTFRAELKTLDGQTLRIPEDTAGKWAVIAFSTGDAGHAFLRRYGSFSSDRPMKDVRLFAAMLNDNVAAARQALADAKPPRSPDTFPTLHVPDGMRNPLVQKLGILAEDERVNLVILRPDGTIANALSGLTMQYQKGSVIQSVLEWHDEKAVDDALARGDLEQAKQLAFTFAPVQAPMPPDQKQPRKKEIPVPHLRSRAKVYMAMQDWQAAFTDIEDVYLRVNSKAGWLSMRTEELDRTEELKGEIRGALGESRRSR